MSDRPSSPFAAMRHRDFRLFEAARFLQVLGMQVLAVSVGWQIYDLTRDPLHLGYVGLTQFGPGVALALVAGHTADRHDRRRIVMTCLAGALFCAGLLAARSRNGVPALEVLYGILVLLGVVRAFGGPAGQALLPALVPVGDFRNAVNWHLMVFQFGATVGPALGGLLYDHAGVVWAYGAAGGLFAAAFACVAVLRAPRGSRLGEELSAAAFLAGVRYVAGHRVILGAISLDLFAVLLGGATALLPAVARDVLHTGPAELGLLRSAQAVGALAAALWLTWRPLRRHMGPRLLGYVVVFGLAIAAFGLSDNLYLSVAALAVAGAADMVSVTVRHTLIQLTTPDAMRGRVTAVTMVFIGASNELGEFESGLTARWFGTRTAIVLGGGGACAVVAFWAWLFPELRAVDRVEVSTEEKRAVGAATDGAGPAPAGSRQ